MGKKDIFINRKIYPNAGDIFSVTSEPLSKIKNKAIYFLDTNALLLPYTTSSKSIAEIEKVYKQLIDKKHLFIPSQVAREFAKNRPEKIKEIFQQLSRKRSKLPNLYSGKYPLLSESKPYQEAIQLEEAIDSSIKKYAAKLNEVVDQIKNWSWDDPVTKTYNSLFNEGIIVETSMTEEQIEENLQLRYEHKIPPGYKDGGKEDDGIGDLLIWLTILEYAKKLRKDVIFVSGEEKADWFHRSEGQILYPRFELIAEFREKAIKKSFHIIKLSELLEVFGADETVVKELEFEERSSMVLSFADFRKNRRKVESAIYNWLFDSYSGNYELRLEELGFPDIIMSNKSERVGVEILYLNKPEMALHRFSDVFNKAYVATKENEFTKMIFVLAYDKDTEVGVVRKNSERINSKYGEMNLDFELIVGFVDRNQKFVIFG